MTSTSPLTLPPPHSANPDMNACADFLHDGLGVNVFPADSRQKRPSVVWAPYQLQPVPRGLFDEWKAKDLFKDGIAIMPGRAWHNSATFVLWLVVIDFDKKERLDAFLGECGLSSIGELAKITLVVQHDDEPDRAHVYFYVTRPIPKLDSHRGQGIEVKSDGTGVMMAPLSMHKNGHRYRILGTHVPAVRDDIAYIIDKVCKKNGICYLNGAGHKVLEVVRPWYILGYRNSRVFAISGQLRKLGWSLADVEELVSRLCDAANDDERQSRLAAVRRTFEQPITHVAGYSYLPQELADAIERIAQEGKGNAQHRTDNSSGSSSRKDQVTIENHHNAVSQEPSKSKAEVAFELAKENCSEFFVDEHQQPFAVINIDDHNETLPLSGSRFKHWLSLLYYDREKGLLTETEINNALHLAKAQALFRGKQRKLELRVGAVLAAGTDKPEILYYDLVTPNWECIQVTAEGWKKVPAPVHFRRFSSNQAQVEPSRQYDVDVFDQFMALTNVVRSDWLLVKCYIISLFYSEIAKAILMPHGEKGSSKSTFQRSIKKLVDPSSMEFLSIPRDTTQLVQNLSHNYLSYYDNVSYIPDWLSDEFCKAVTGGGFAKRMLYTDDDDIIYSYRRALGFNGINLAATRPDLLDRGISIHLQRIPKDRRKTERQIWVQFERLRPGLLGYIMDILVKVLQNWESVKLVEHPRMADFARFCELAARCMGYEENAFIRAYDENITLHIDEAIAASPVATSIIKLMEDREIYEGTASELLTELESIADGMKWNTKEKRWPANPQVLGKRINEVISDLREKGIVIEKALDAKINVKRIRIRKEKRVGNSTDSPGRPDPAQKD